MSKIENDLLVDDKWSSFDKFFKLDGKILCLSIYFQEKGDFIETTQHLLKVVYLPAIQSNQNWGCLERYPEQKTQLLNEFVDTTWRYLRLLKQIQEGSGLHFLSAPSKEDEALIASLKRSKDFKGLNKDVLRRLDGVLSAWNKQVRLTVNELNLIIKETDDAGPSDELAYWRSRWDTLNSENKIFGKFDAFCRRLSEIDDLLIVVENLRPILTLHADDTMDVISAWQSMLDSIHQWTGDPTDPRNKQFTADLESFQAQRKSLLTQINSLLDKWLSRRLSASHLLHFLSLWEIRITDPDLDFVPRYLQILRVYGDELEHVRDIYEEEKRSPPLERGMTPTAGRIRWARALLHRIRQPLDAIHNRCPSALETPEGQKQVKRFNQLATVLVKYEAVNYRKWCKSLEDTSCKLLESPLLTRDPERGQFSVNPPFTTLTIIRESQILRKLGLKVPKIAMELLLQERELKNHNDQLKEQLLRFEKLQLCIAQPMTAIFQPFLNAVAKSLYPGVADITWNSMQFDNFIKKVALSLDKFELVVKQARDLLDCRINVLLTEMLTVLPLDLRDCKALSIEAFLQNLTSVLPSTTVELNMKSKLVESAVNDLVETLMNNLDKEYAKVLSKENHFSCSNPTKKGNRCNHCLNCLFFDLLSQFSQRNIEAVITCRCYILSQIFHPLHVYRILEELRSRLQADVSKPGFISSESKASVENEAFFVLEMSLEIPNIVCRPSLTDLQAGLSRAINMILRVSDGIQPWDHVKHCQMLFKKSQSVRLNDLLSSSQDSSTISFQSIPSSLLRPLRKLVQENKNIIKVVADLNSCVTYYSGDIARLVNELSSDFSYLWKAADPLSFAKEFIDKKPSISEVGDELRRFKAFEEASLKLPASYRLGSLLLRTEAMKDSLIAECRSWRLAIGSALNTKCGVKMTSALDKMEDLLKRLQRPVKDLDDIRAKMAALDEFRQSEIDLELFLIEPMAEAYSLLASFDVHFTDGNAERVESLAYTLQKLKTQASASSKHLLFIQPVFKAELEACVEQFQKENEQFTFDYRTRGPMEQNIDPHEASDRLALFNARFDDLWAKYETYSEGERLFGLPVREYPDLHTIQKELGLLQKLYQLYNSVLDTIGGYYNTPWTNIDIEMINQQLIDFQTRCRRLPKGLKEWPAYEALQKKIDDFNETCPLLEMMANKSMLPRHWKRIETVTNCQLDVYAEGFLLKNLMELPLLEHKEDIEDICTSSVKERDIEAKLKSIINDWTAQEFQFSVFKNRGELLFKGDVAIEAIALLEDSLMALSSLLSNRYNAPFKPRIQEWVHKLTTTNEVIENLFKVQNLWVYLEAVFVGGDIAKQLPQEAKRFATIDKSWQRVVQRAHETSNMVACCSVDDTLTQVLPYLLEQLEVCQKSLTGYLESKRLVFPRFFFVSDPALLEILGQASDSHTIQAHLLSVFDSIKSVTFDETVYDRILAVNSTNETIELEAPVMAQGHVEVWLGELLKMAQESLRQVIHSAYCVLNDEENFDLLKFEDSFIAQVGLLGLQLLWTRDAEDALSNARTNPAAMRETNLRFLKILNQLIEVTTKELTPLERTKYETLITIHVHQKDIFDDLVKMRVKSPTDLEWLKQSRSYYNEEREQYIVSITDVDFIYQNEFLGCTDRLVITPLTDRCYITLAQALGMSLGGAPAGPAGTGKTETVKDMGRCLGKYVVVFNCSDQMDYRGLGRIFKGLAQSGAWGCFDEFNRIELPVLSVAAQQIAIVLACKKERKHQFVFSDGDVVDMNPEFGIFLTMNPGYAGRQELPENLKINFRTVSMMVPDRQIIIRVKLAACGFLKNIELAAKFYTLYKLCEEQLSKQVHYDFGLRNILSVLRTLGAFKRANTDQSEPICVMRVLRDMNVSKLVDEDEPLFMSLIDDLFPGMHLEKKGYPSMEAAIKKEVEDQQLIFHPPWVLKLIQMYETQRVRHGFMALGPSGSGKTCCITTLLAAMTAETGVPYREMRMNPKAITAPQMFGRLDVATNDWTDGIFSTLWRRTTRLKKAEHCWIVLDGPVDAIWIENLNSVLDDNKTLTLANGDRIPMAPNAKIVFEVHNIDNASPATVSRNGMIYMSSSILNWKPIIQAWLLRKSPKTREVVMSILEKFFEDAYRYVIENLKAKMELLECNYIKQIIDLLEGQLQDRDEKELPDECLRKLVIFASMWSLGAPLELEERGKLEQLLRTNHADLPLPEVTKGDTAQTMFEFLVDNDGNWQHWSSRVEDYVYPHDSTPDYTKILVPNVDNTRTEFLIHTIAKQAKPVLLIGVQGSAKTVMVKGYCGRSDPETHLVKTVNFSYATTPNMFQRTVESFVEKRVGSTYGPPTGKKLTIFIDDINMPLINEWGDQVTNEITRQMIEMRGFYNLEKPGDFTNIVDIEVIAAMIHPGGGRNDIPQRLKRHFSVFNCTLPSDTSMDRIFSCLAEGHFCEERSFLAEVRNLARTLVSSTRLLWQRVKAKMLPTPAKFHYVFDLRDISRVWQGMLRAEAEVISTPQRLLALWWHEVSRVIADRFIDFDEKKWFVNALKQTGEEVGGATVASELCSKEPFFVDFLRDPPEATGDEPDDFVFEAPKIYEPVDGLEALANRLSHFQTMYNETTRGTKLDLVFFADAMIHLVKICRILRLPKGHALLVGVGGSGKQSLTKLATFIVGYQNFQITLTRSYNVSNLMDDLKILYRLAGHEDKGVTFIFSDNDVKEEAFLEPLNNMLASGEVAGLFARDEIDEILSDLAQPMKHECPRVPPTNENLYEYYMRRVSRNLHVCLCFSPIGQKFRTRSLRFKSLISGCTMDWFQPWPREALVAVSQHLLKGFDIVCRSEEAIIKSVLVNIMGMFHDRVSTACRDYFQRMRRQTYVTPKSYLSFVTTYKSTYSTKRGEIDALASRMVSGLEKLSEATEAVNKLSEGLVVMERELAAANQKAEAVLTRVKEQAHAAQAVKEQVQVVKDRAEKLVEAISKDKGIAEERLEAARPALEEAEEALKTIKPAHIATVRKLGRPPHLIMRIMDCVLILFRKPLDAVTPDPEKPCPKPSWTEALKLMGNTAFLSNLLNFSKDTITDETIDLMEPYFQMDDFNLEQAKRVCGDVAGLCSWTKAMAAFFAVNKEVIPLKNNLVVQETRLAQANAELSDAQAQLDEKQAELDRVQAEYDKAMAEKQRLADDAEACRRKMANATALIEGLSGEKVRWTEAKAQFQTQIENLVGDVLLATAFLSYAGPFNQEFRNLLNQQWDNELSRTSIPRSPDLNIVSMLVDNTMLGLWNLQGLPGDDLSIQNGLIVTMASRFPLLIDPQGQGKAWIINREADSNLMVSSLNHKYFRSHLEDALSQGRPMLIADVGEELDPALDHVLERDFVRVGTGYKVRVGDKEVDVDVEGFRLYITTKLPNPLYSPEVFARTSTVDFTVTQRGLEDQLLRVVILTEKKELEAERTSLLEEVTSNKQKVKDLEDSLLLRLTSTEGSLVEDESLIKVLRVTKATAEEVRNKLLTAAETELKINTAREQYRPVATRGSILYFLIVEMSMVNVMYQTSLRQFLERFDLSMSKSPGSPVTHKRIRSIIDHLMLDVFRYIARGLYEKDKFTFTLLLALKVALQEKKISIEEFQIFIKGGAALDLNAVEQKPRQWIQDMTWLNLVELSRLSAFANILKDIPRKEKSWKHWFDSDSPEDNVLPAPYEVALEGQTFQRLLLVRCWCLDRCLPMSRRFIKEMLGEAFVDPVITDLETMVLQDSDPHTPLICFLSMGSDPTENIERLAKRRGLAYGAVSMGQGQEVHARRLIAGSMTEGKWVLLQNCHLGLNFMDELLDLITTSQNVHESFRCWITTEPHPKFPIALLQISTKFTFDPPMGVRAGLLRTYAMIGQEGEDQLEASSAVQWKPLLYAVAFLHTIVQERRKFGPIGWNIPYEFNQADFTSTVQFIQNHLDDMDAHKGISWPTIRYMIGEVQYGGRVTDDYDKRLLNTYAQVWFTDRIFMDDFQFYTGYGIPKARTVEEYQTRISELPATDSPECFGLHPNADITCQTNNALAVLTTIANIQPKDSSGGGGETRETFVNKMAEEMLSKLPPDYNPFEVKELLQQLDHLKPLHICLRHELDRIQRVISLVRSTLSDLKLAIDGTIIMSENLRDALDNIYDARIPAMWKKVSWDSATLGFWFTDLLDRNTQLHSWLFHGRPKAYWLTGFFNPQGFLTAMRQEIARANKFALDVAALTNEVTRMSHEEVSRVPQEGVYIYGLYLDGAGWDRKAGRLMEPPPKLLYTPLPVVHLSTYCTTGQAPTAPVTSTTYYSCPVYRKPSRRDLNFIFPLQLRTNRDPSYWILRGVALLCDIK
uniref:Dynein heavy chain n=1 Tax=Echinococcus granulosus TaxID=6210 RepID=A0A068WKN2_ECHGR|nr:dynein heavy chain [Echinococcus granulosus]